MMMGGFGMGYGIFGSFMMLLFWVLIIGAIVFGVRWFWRDGSWTSGPGHDTALDILKRRYANGEINREEFVAKKEELS